MNKLRIIPLGGGPGMVTNNMYLYEYGQDAIIVDCGIGFPEDKDSDDILIPDISYLASNRRTIHGLILTHGHDDHHAALPHILPKLGPVPIYASSLTAGFAQDKLNEYKLNQKIKILKETDQLKLGPFTINPIHITHSVPDSFHFLITTPIGSIYHGSDFKFDLTPLDKRPPNFSKIVDLSKKGILCLLSDCLRSERSGFSPSESTITEPLHREISQCQGRVIFTTMSSQIHRIQQAVDVATAYGRKVAFIGRSMDSNTQIAMRLGFLKLNPKSIIKPHQIKKYPDHKLCLLVAGSQGQESSSLTRYSTNTHKLIKIKPADTVIYSADIIPGNEQLVYQVIDQLNQAGIPVVYEDTVDDLHVSGHASAKELQLLMQLVNAQHLYPIGGSFRHMQAYKKLGLKVGYRPDQLILPHGNQVVEFDNSGRYSFAETLKLKQIRFNQNKNR
jgi:ribonuclease J